MTTETQVPAINLYDIFNPTSVGKGENTSSTDKKLPAFRIKTDVSPVTLLVSSGFGVLTIDILIELGIAGAAMGGFGLITSFFAAVGVIATGAMMFSVIAGFFHLFGL